MNRLAIILILLLSTIVVAVALEPDEILDNPVLEQRARLISSGLRCLVCQNQSIDDSNADLARDLRQVVRERLLAGDSDDEVFDYVVARYGEFVLLKPTFSAHNLFLWLAAPVVFVLGALVLLSMRRKRKIFYASLSEAEQTELNRLLGD